MKNIFTILTALVVVAVLSCTAPDSGVAFDVSQLAGTTWDVNGRRDGITMQFKRQASGKVQAQFNNDTYPKDKELRDDQFTTIFFTDPNRNPGYALSRGPYTVRLQGGNVLTLTSVHKEEFLRMTITDNTATVTVHPDNPQSSEALPTYGKLTLVKQKTPS